MTTLRKFEHQSGLKATLQMQGHGMPLAPDMQMQVLHIVQEALSNVRKHARATQVWLDVQQQPQWRFEVRDDGVGFDAGRRPPDETHVGLRIMAERAERIGAGLEVMSTPGRGTSVVLTLPPRAAQPLRRAPRRRSRCRDELTDERPPSSPIRILVVDDHTLFRRGLMALLARDPQLRGRRRRRRRRRGAAARAGAAARPDPAGQPPARRQRRRRAAGTARGGAGRARADADRQRGRAGPRGGAARRRLRLPAQDDRRRRAGAARSRAPCAARRWWPRR